MKSNLYPMSLIILALVFPACMALAADDGNAADPYREALKQTPVSAEDLATYKAATPTPEAVKAVLEKGAKSLSLLHDASAMTKTDWKIDASDKTDTYLAFLSNLRSLDELSYLAVDADIAAGKTNEAADALVDRLLLGRRVQKIRFGLTMLMGQTIEKSFIAQAAAHLPNAGDDAIAILAKGWDRARPPTGIDDILEADHVDAQSKEAAKLRLIESQIEVLRAMFSAALKAPKGGADQFMSTKDPEGGKPFTYTALADGYQLTSAMQYKGKPVTLTVGKPDDQR